jgi:hypothetical protein
LQAQLEIQFFYPLTEQIPLELDFKLCLDYEERKRKESLYTGNRFDYWGNGASLIYTTTGSIASSFTIDMDKLPITIQSKNRPNIIKRLIYWSLGMKWKKN